MKVLIPIFITLLIINKLLCQEYAFVTIQDTSEYSNKHGSQYFKYLRFEVNGIEIDSKNGIHKIQITTNSLDSVLVFNQRDTSEYYVYCKLKANEHYQIRFNTCSLFEIAPESYDLSQKKYLRVIKRNCHYPIYVESGFCELEMPEIRMSDTTKYHRCYSSGMCPFARSNIGFCKTQDEPEYDMKKDESICTDISFMFLHGEKYSVVYDYNKHRTLLKFDGYFDPKTDEVEYDSEGRNEYLKNK